MKVIHARQVFLYRLVPIRSQINSEAGNVIETHEHTGDFKEW